MKWKTWIWLIAVLLATTLCVYTAEAVQAQTTWGFGPTSINVGLNWEAHQLTIGRSGSGYSYASSALEPVDGAVYPFDLDRGEIMYARTTVSLVDPNAPWPFEEVNGWYCVRLDSMTVRPMFRIDYNAYRKDIGAPDSSYAICIDEYPRYLGEYLHAGDPLQNRSFLWKAGDYRIVYSIRWGTPGEGVQPPDELYKITLSDPVRTFTITQADPPASSKYEFRVDGDTMTCIGASALEGAVRDTPNIVNPYPDLPIGVLYDSVTPNEAGTQSWDLLSIPFTSQIDLDKSSWDEGTLEGFSVDAVYKNRKFINGYAESRGPYDVNDNYTIGIAYPALPNGCTQVRYLYIDGGCNHTDKVIAVVIFTPPVAEYTQIDPYAEGLNKTYDGQPASFSPEYLFSPVTGSETYKWYAIEDGQLTEIEGDSYQYFIGYYVTIYTGPTDVGEYELDVLVGGEVVLTVPFAITGYQPMHQYALTASLDKIYDGKPVAFNASEMILVDEGDTLWSDLEMWGEARYRFRRVGISGGKIIGEKKGKEDPGEGSMDDYDTPEGSSVPPTAVGFYELVIQEGNEKQGYNDAASFPFGIMEPEEMFTVTFDTQGGSAVVTQQVESGGLADEPENPIRIGYLFGGWYGDASCSPEQVFAFGNPIMDDLTLYAYWIEPEVTEYLRLPDDLVTIESEAFADTSADAVIIPAGVLSIAGDPFAGSHPPVYVFGYPGTTAETFAEAYGYSFVPIDDAWLAGHSTD